MSTPNLDYLQEAVDNHLLLCQVDFDSTRHVAVFREGVLSALLDIATSLRELKEAK